MLSHWLSDNAELEKKITRDSRSQDNGISPVYLLLALLTIVLGASKDLQQQDDEKPTVNWSIGNFD